MTDQTPDQPPFVEWITRPQMLVALAAIVLSVCGLFISVYEAWLYRQQQHATVWPHVEVGVSVRADSIMLIVENTGVGPAGIRAAEASHEGETVANWTELLDAVGSEPDSVDVYQSFINGRVLPANSSETIFAVTGERGAGGRDPIAPLRRAILGGDVDVAVCYCSVYDDCWTASLQDLIARFRGEPATGAIEVDGCEEAGRSRI